MTAHLELLAIQAEGALVDLRGITIACTRDDQVLWIGGAVPPAQAAELAAAWSRRARPASPIEEPPAVLDACARILGDGFERRGGPSYVFPPGARLAAAHVEIVRSGERVHDRNPGNWHPVEWAELLAGRLGPWAIALAPGGDRVASICHTPGPPTPRGIECGVWTDPDLRGRGYAAAAAAAWAELVRPSGRHRFYSTDADNRSSQQVARRLGLELIGWTWRLLPPSARGGLHPLCSLAARSGYA